MKPPWYVIVLFHPRRRPGPHIHPRYGETMRLPFDEETDTGKGF
jgi:hypothetical protein